MDAIFNRTSIRKYKQESLKKEEIDLIWLNRYIGDLLI